MKLKKVILVFVMLPIFYLGVKIHAAIEFRTAVMHDKRASDTVKLNNQSISWVDFVLKYAVKGQQGPLTYYLVNESSSTLWGSLYVVAGLAGGVAFYWLLLLPSSPTAKEPNILEKYLQWPEVFFRLLLAGFAGFLCYLLVPVSAAKIIIRQVPPAPNLDGQSVYDTFLWFPVLAGLFLSKFYEDLAGILGRLLTSLGSGGTQHDPDT